jgi:processive 1,2-diacylglycerol beta-glucosyltransferase
MPHVHVIEEHGPDGRSFGSAHIRLLRPLGHPANQPRIRMSHGFTYQPAEVVVVQRMWKPGGSLAAAEQLVDAVRRDGGKLIYEIDDNLLDLNELRTGTGAPPLPSEALMTVRYFAREAHGITVSTEPLKQRLLNLNTNIAVINNALDERLFGERSAGGRACVRRRIPARSKRVVIGYMGTLTHDADVMMVLKPLREVLRAHWRRLEFQVVGAVADPAMYRLFDDLPVSFLNVGRNDDYPDFVRWMLEHARWDLAIAPLEDSAFARCKSDIKFLDYSALGIPAVYSSVPSYQASVQNGETGVLVNNNADEWTDALETLIADDALRRHLAQRSQQYVFANRVLRHRASDWADAIERLCGAGEALGVPAARRISKVNHGHRRTLRPRARLGTGSVHRPG